jgi:hypothetical protein
MTTEGPRGFTHFIDQLGDGEAAQEMSAELHDLIKKLTTESRNRNVKIKGSYALSLKFEADPRGTVAVEHDIKTVEPKPLRLGDTFFTTKGGNLTKQNEKQQSLKLHDVNAKRVVVEDEEAVAEGSSF